MRLIDRALIAIRDDGLEATTEVADELGISVKHARLLLVALWSQGFLTREKRPTFQNWMDKPIGRGRPLCHRYSPSPFPPTCAPNGHLGFVAIPKSPYLAFITDKPSVGVRP